MPRRDHHDAALRFGDDDEMEDLGYGRTYDEDEEDEEGWTSSKHESDLWDEPEEASLDEEEEGLADRELVDEEEGGEDEVADLFADDAPKRGRKRGVPLAPPAPPAPAPIAAPVVAAAIGAAKTAPAKKVAAPQSTKSKAPPPPARAAARTAPAKRAAPKATKKKVAKKGGGECTRPQKESSEPSHDGQEKAR